MSKQFDNKEEILEAGLDYFNQRPWLKDEYKRVTGNDLDDLFSDEDAGTDPEASSPASDSGNPDQQSSDDNSDDSDEDYSEWDYDDLKAEVKERALDVPDQKKETLIAALEADDEE